MLGMYSDFAGLDADTDIVGPPLPPGTITTSDGRSIVPQNTLPYMWEKYKTFIVIGAAVGAFLLLKRKRK
jgi:hypothetical protein